jgi:hypothetical protein
MKKLILVSILLITVFFVFPENKINDKSAKDKYIEAEKYFFNDEYEKCISSLTSLKSLLGKTNTKIQYYLVLSYIKLEKFIEAKKELAIYKDVTPEQFKDASIFKELESIENKVVKTANRYEANAVWHKEQQDFIESIRNGDTDKVRDYISQNIWTDVYFYTGNNKDETGVGGWYYTISGKNKINFETALSAAVINNRSDIVSELLKTKAADTINVFYDTDGTDKGTPLQIAVSKKNTEIVSELLMAGADPDYRFDKTTEYPLYTALINDDFEIVNELLKYSILQKSFNSNKDEIWKIIIQKDSIELAKHMIETNISDCNAVINTEYGEMSILSYSKKSNKEKVAKYLSEKILKEDIATFKTNKNAFMFGGGIYVPIYNNEFLNYYRLGAGFNIMYSFGTVDFVKGYLSNDMLISFTNQTLNKNIPKEMKFGFLLQDNFSMGIMFITPTWRFPLFFGIAPKLGLLIEYTENMNENMKSNFDFGFGFEGVAGIKFMITNTFGLFIYYKAGLLQSLNHLYKSPVPAFFNIDYHTISIGFNLL